MHDGTEWGWSFGFGHWIFGLFFWILVFAAIVALIRVFSRNDTSVHRSKSALDILEERYARGEIDRIEYERMRHDLER